MSYLNAVRLHFAGQFQANVSTVNNDPAHFDNAAFKPSYQEMQGSAPNGWFNPQGDAAFRLKGCAVTSAWLASGAVDPSDPIGQCLVADADSAVPAKLVDLDSEQQLVSTIWGLTVRICDPTGRTLVSGNFEPAAFTDIWDRATGRGQGDIGAGATYQSVLTDVAWDDVAASPFLTGLKAASAGTGQLSIKFMVDGLSMDFTSPDFMCGRIVGTIGPALPHEPQHLVSGRHFMPEADPDDPGNFFNPAGRINFCSAVLDETASVLYLDLGNALQTAQPGGWLDDIGNIEVCTYQPRPADGSAVVADPFATVLARDPDGYLEPGWYARTAGVVPIPLTPQQVALVSGLPLALSATTAPYLPPAWVRERPAGTHLRADAFVFRMSPGDTVDIPIYATQWGQPLAGAEVEFVIDNGQLQAQVGTVGPRSPYVADSPPVGVPEGVLTFPPSVTTDPQGIAHLTVRAGDPGTPRWVEQGDYGIDGQVYGIRPSFADDRYGGPVNQWDFVSFLVWSSYPVPETVTWADVHPIFQQYANLYPVMMRFLDLADRDQLVANAGLLKLAFSLPMTDPNTMPVTRDLSPAKRQAILKWLDDPRPGDVPAAAARPADTDRALAPPSAPPSGPPSAEAVMQGGKAAAAARRLVLRTQETGARR